VWPGLPLVERVLPFALEVYRIGENDPGVRSKRILHNVFDFTLCLPVGPLVDGLLLTLVHSLPAIITGLAVFSSGMFISQSAATVLTGRVARHARSAAAGLYVTFYYIGGSAGTVVTSWFWTKAGWPGCIGLFAAVSLATLGFGLLGGKIKVSKAGEPVIDVAC
jgi:predicted MFS family arabinose efflux permease